MTDVLKFAQCALSRVRKASLMIALVIANMSGHAWAADAKPPHISVAAIACDSTCTTINGSPLSINVGRNFDFQVFNSNIPNGQNSGQFFSSGAQIGDAGWFVRIGATTFGPPTTQDPNPNSAMTGTLSAVAGAGTADDPLRVQVTGASLGTTGISASQTVSYINGRGYFTKTLALANTTASSVSTRVFFGSDIFLSSSDFGYPFREPISGAPGGQTSDRSYTILHVAKSPATSGWFAGGYSTVWSQISAGALSNSIQTTSIVDNGAALQWDVVIPANGSTSITTITTFGDIPAEVVGSAIVPASARLDVTQHFVVTGENLTSVTSVTLADCPLIGAFTIVSATRLEFDCKSTLPGKKALRLNGGLVTNGYVFVDHPARIGNPSTRGVPSINGVSLWNGNYFHEVTDISVPGRGIPFSLSRSFNSYYSDYEDKRGGVDNYKPWRFNWAVTLGYVPGTSNTQIFVEQADGSGKTFVQANATSWYPIDQGSFDKLEFSAATNRFSHYQRNGLVYEFEAIASGGKLKAVRDHNNNALNVGHDANARVATVTDTMNRVFTFSYYPTADARAGLLYRVTNADGQAIHGTGWYVEYDWTADAAPGTGLPRARLKTARNLRGFATTYTYQDYGTVGSVVGPRTFLSRITDPRAKNVINLTYVSTVYGNWGVNTLANHDGDTYTFNFCAKQSNATCAGVTTATQFETTITPPEGGLRYARFDTAGRATEFTDGNGKTSKTQPTPTATLTPQTYNLAALPVQRQSARGVAGSFGTTFQYTPDNAGTTAQVTDAENFSRQQTWASDSSLLAKNLYLPATSTSATGLPTGSSYDINTGNLTVRTDPGGATTRYQNYTNGQPGTILDQRNYARTLSFAATAETVYAGYLTQITHPATSAGMAIEKFEYDRLGRVVKYTDARGSVTTTVYNEMGQATSVTTNPVPADVTKQRIVSSSYDASNNLLQKVDARRQPTVFAYDNANRLQSTTMDLSVALGGPQQIKTQYAYDKLGRVKQVTNPRANVASTTFDAAGNVKTKKLDSLPSLPVTTYDYDEDNRVIKVTDPDARVTGTTYDKVGRVKTVTRTAIVSGVTQTNTIENEYDGDGRLSKVTDAKNKTRPKRYEYWNQFSGVGYAGRLARVYDGNTGPSGDTFASVGNYDEAGNPRLLRDPNQNFINIEYDSLNREIGRYFGNQNVKWTTQYDLSGNVVGRTAPGGLVTTYTYDLANQLKSVTLPGAASAITFDYDKNGNRTQMTDATGATVYDYDGANRLTKVTDPQAKVVQFAYDQSGNRAKVTYPHGQFVTYGYDQAERLNLVTPWVGGATSYTLDKSGRVIGAIMGNGTSMVMNYDEAGRLKLLDNQSPAVPGGFISHHALTLDPNGNIATAATTLPLELDVPASSTVMTHDFYANRLLTVNGQSVTHDPAFRVSNLLGDTYTYDGRDLITSVTGSIPASYTYNGLGHRVLSTIGGASKRYVFDPNPANPTMQNVLTETDSVGTSQRHYIYGYGLLAQVDSANTIKHYHFDPTGHTLALTNASGAITDAYAYTSYGTTTARGDTVNPYRYVGKYGVADDGNGLHHMRARYYRPDIARFLSLDALPGEVGESQSLNRYAYSASDPVGKIDPSGNIYLAAGSISASPVPYGGEPSSSACPMTDYQMPGNRDFYLYSQAVGSSRWFHGGLQTFKGKYYAADGRKPECAYDESRKLVTDSHPMAGCGGSANQYEVRPKWYMSFTGVWSFYMHTIHDDGGVVSVAGMRGALCSLSVERNRWNESGEDVGNQLFDLLHPSAPVAPTPSFFDGQRHRYPKDMIFAGVRG